MKEGEAFDRLLEEIGDYKLSKEMKEKLQAVTPVLEEIKRLVPELDLNYVYGGKRTNTLQNAKVNFSHSGNVEYNDHSNNYHAPVIGCSAVDGLKDQLEQYWLFSEGQANQIDKLIAALGEKVNAG